MAAMSLMSAGACESGFKIPKERLTSLVCCNMDGSDKRKLFVIGKSANPRGFPKNKSSLPVKYSSNKNAWMTASLWREYMHEWDRECRLKQD